MATFYPGQTAASYLAALNALANNGSMAVIDAPQTYTAMPTFGVGIAIPTGQSITGAGTAAISGFLSVAATTGTFTNVGGTLSTAAQPNVTSVGILTSLTTGAINVNTTANSFFSASAASTSRKYFDVSNTGGSFILGVDSSTGGSITSGTSAYSTVFGPNGLTDLHLMTNNTVRLTIASTGAASFGTNSLTAGAISGTTIAVGTNPASTGVIRIPNNTQLIARNVANSGDIALIGSDSSNNVTVGGGGQTLISGTAVVSGNVTLGTSNPILTLGVPATNGSAIITLLGSNSDTNWQIATNNFGVGGGLLFVPSTAGGGSTFTTPTLKLTAGAVSVTGTLGVTGAVTTDGGLQTFGANDSAGAGYRLVKVPNV